MAPDGFLPRFAAELDVPDQVRHRALDLAERAEARGIANGAKPSGVAAACLYAAAREQGVVLLQGDLAEVAHISRGTIRTHWYAIAECCD